MNPVIHQKSFWQRSWKSAVAACCLIWLPAGQVRGLDLSTVLETPELRRLHAMVKGALGPKRILNPGKFV